ncbi:MAG TPA: hypothetical protein VGM79_24855 [Streptosporangiaceae bacterium]|jgi:hypothetical protein
MAASDKPAAPGPGQHGGITDAGREALAAARRLAEPVERQVLSS